MVDVETAPRVAAPGAQVGASVKAQPPVQAPRSHPTDHGTVSDEERARMIAYWKEHSAEPTVEMMMLDTQAALLDAAERPEILGLIPDNLEGVRVLELGAGIGRFTGALARRGASRVHAVDFMENLIQENEKQHANLGNTSFEAADVMQMALAAGSFDLVFTNWLFMYLNDAELSALAPRLLRCLSAGGRLFFRESCNRQSGDRSRAFNPSHYRSAEAYTALFGELRGADGSRFMLESTGSVKAYIELKNNPNQIFWVWRKCA